MIDVVSHPGVESRGLSTTCSAGDAATVAIARQRWRIGRAAAPAPTRLKPFMVWSALRDFYLAVTFRRSGRPCTSSSFDRCVLAGQIAVALLVVAALLPSVKPLVTPAPPEITVIEAWMENQYSGPVKIHDYGSPQPNPNGSGMAVRVSYRYQSSNRKSVSTSQWFLIENDQVISVDSEL